MTPEDPTMDRQKLEKAAHILKTVAHPTRLAIVELLAYDNELPVGEICSHLGCEQSLVSHHLTNMRLKGILAARKAGTSVYYSLKERQILKIIECVQNCDPNA